MLDDVFIHDTFTLENAIPECLARGYPKTFLWKRCTCEGSGEILVVKKMNSEEFDKVKDNVKNYYGKILKTSDDIQSNASKIDEYNGMTSAVKSALKLIHEEVSNK